MKFTVALCLALSASLFAQQSPAPKPKDAAPPQAAQAPAEPTELESTQIENLELKSMLLEQEAATIPQRRTELQQQYGKLIQKIESEHPGFVWNPQANRLVPASPAAAPAKKDEAPKK